MKKILVALLFMILLPCTVFADAKKYRYLVDAANRMMGLIGESMNQSPETLAKVTSQACHALTILAKDRSFKNDLYKIAKSEDRLQLKGDLILFIETFLMVEEKALIQAGVKEDVAKRILWSANYSHEAVDKELNPDKTLYTINKLREDICEGAKHLAKIKDQKERQKTFVKWAYKLGGVVMIIVDIPLYAAHPGIATASMVLGTEVASWGEEIFR